MAKAIRKSQTVRRTVNKPLGKRWMKDLERSMIEDARKVAKARFKAGEEDDGDDIVVKMTVNFFVGFARDLKSLNGDGGTVRCHCRFTQPGVCVCSGHCTLSDDCDVA